MIYLVVVILIKGGGGFLKMHISKKVSSFVLFLSVLMLTAFLLGGCSSAGEKAVETGTGGKVKVDTQSGKVKVETEEGQAEIEAGSELSLPEGFPEDFPLYENGKIKSSIKSTSEGKEGYMILVESEDAPADVASWYKDALKQKGYEVKFSLEQQDAYSFSFENASRKITGSVQIVKSDTGSEITIFIVY